MAIFRFFKMAAIRYLGFKSWKFQLPVPFGDAICVIVPNFAKISQTVPEILLIIDFSRWRPSAILDWFYVCWDHPRRVLGGLCDCANFNILHVKLENAYSRPQNRGFGGFYPQNGEQYERDPQKAHPWAKTRRMTYRSSKSVHFCVLGASRKIKQKKIFFKGIPKKPQHVFFHVFAQTTHVVAAPRGFACVVIPATRLYIPIFIEISSGVSEPQGVKI